MGIDAEAVYGAIEEEGPVDFSPTSPSKTPTSPTSPERSVAREQNAARQFLWTSLDAVMLRPAETASNLPVPLAAVLTPFADTADFTSLPLSDIGSDEPLRCPRCRCYANPHFKWSARENRKFTCNMCSHSLDVPQKFLEDMERNGQCADCLGIADADTHPELVYGSVDFTAGALIEPDLPGPFVPSVCFAIETSPDAISSGFTKAALEALEKALQDSREMCSSQNEAPHTLERDVYLVTFDEAVTFYVPISHGRFRAVVMPDMEEPFVPVSPESLGVHVADPDGKEMFLELLSTLQEEFTDEASPQCGYGGEDCIALNLFSGFWDAVFEESPDPFHLGECQDLTSSTVLRTGVQTLAALGGGDLVLFQVSVPSTWGPEEAPEDDDVLKRKRSFLEEMHRSCCRTGVAVSAVTATSDGDVSRLHWLPWRTGGDVLHMPSFTPTATQSMSSHLQHWLQKMQASAYNCVVKLRCSKGLSCKALLAPWPAAASSEDQSAFEVPRLSPDMSVTFSLLPEVEPDSDEDSCFKTHTRSLTVISSARQIFGSINIAPLMAFLLKQAAMIALDPAQNAKLPRDMLLESCLQILASFRRRCLDYNSAKKAMAETLLRKVVKTRTTKMGEDIPTYEVLRQLAATLVAQGKHLEAEKLYRQAVQGLTAMLGNQHLRTLSCLRGLAAVLHRNSKLEEAELAYKRSYVGFLVQRRGSDRSTEINFRRLAAVAQVLADEDYEFLEEVAPRGVPLGVDEELPRTPAVYEEKLKWTVEQTEEEFHDILADNYVSAEENSGDIARQVLEEVQKGTILRLSERDAREKFGGRLAVAALGAVPKEIGTTRVRLIHDGTYSVDVNRRIRVRDRMRFPLIDDAAAILRQVEEEKRERKEAIRFSVLYDIASAHKLVPVREEDWGLQAFRLPGEDSGDIFVHTRGTFGIASAAYWFGRAIGVVVRCCHRIMGRYMGVLHLIYADDGWLTATGVRFWKKILLWLFLFELLEIPVTWKKVRGGAEVDWIGYHLNVSTFERGINESKRRWIQGWIDTKLEQGGVLGRELKSVLGRLSFVAGALRHVRPFLAPLFSWSATLAGGTFAKFPDAVIILLEYVKGEVSRKPTRPLEPLMTAPIDIFRVDAKAAGEEIVIGGWETWKRVEQKHARWFSFRLNRRNAAWAYLKGDPFRSIATLELIGVLAALAVHPAVGQFILDNAASDKRSGLDAAQKVLLDAKAATSWPTGYSLYVKNGYMGVPSCPKANQDLKRSGSLRNRSAGPRLALLGSLAAPYALHLCQGRAQLWLEAGSPGPQHKVSMVYASAIPVKAYLNAGNLDVPFQEEVGRLVIVSQYFGALRLAYEAAKPGTKQKIFLMPLGGGVFNNRAEVILGALGTALDLLAQHLKVDPAARLDVQLLAFRGSVGEQDRLTKIIQLLVPATAPVAPAAAAAATTPAAPTDFTATASSTAAAASAVPYRAVSDSPLARAFHPDHLGEAFEAEQQLLAKEIMGIFDGGNATCRSSLSCCTGSAATVSQELWSHVKAFAPNYHVRELLDSTPRMLERHYTFYNLWDRMKRAGSMQVFAADCYFGVVAMLLNALPAIEFEDGLSTAQEIFLTAVEMLERNNDTEGANWTIPREPLELQMPFFLGLLPNNCAGSKLRIYVYDTQSFSVGSIFCSAGQCRARGDAGCGWSESRASLAVFKGQEHALPTVLVVAVEPSRRNYELLTKHAREHGWGAEGFLALEAALGATAGRAQLAVREDFAIDEVATLLWEDIESERRSLDGGGLDRAARPGGLGVLNLAM
eukprot:g17163.t1